MVVCVTAAALSLYAIGKRTTVDGVVWYVVSWFALGAALMNNYLGV